MEAKNGGQGSQQGRQGQGEGIDTGTQRSMLRKYSLFPTMYCVFFFLRAQLKKM